MSHPSKAERIEEFAGSIGATQADLTELAEAYATPHILVEVHGNENVLVAVRGADNDDLARRAAYVAVFGSEVEPTAATIEDCTRIPYVINATI